MVITRNMRDDSFCRRAKVQMTTLRMKTHNLGCLASSYCDMDSTRGKFLCRLLRFPKGTPKTL